MMGHRAKLKGGDEFDALTNNWRQVLSFRPGQRQAVKRKFWKRERRKADFDASMRALLQQFEAGCPVK
jgi:hypothetical protein